MMVQIELFQIKTAETTPQFITRLNTRLSELDVVNVEKTKDDLTEFLIYYEPKKKVFHEEILKSRKSKK